MSAETFEAGWLELREAVDHRSRAHGLTEALARWWTERGGSSILDLGSGTGSNMRYLGPRLAGRQEWTLVDHDAGLLARAVGGGAGHRPPGDVGVQTVVCDLTAVGPAVIAGSDLVTASALLDLVSDVWLDGLVRGCVEAGSGALFALTYDGSIEWSPEDPDDLRVRSAVNAHQRGDKGLGPALGPAAGSSVAEAFRGRGYDVAVTPSAWRLGPDDVALARALVEGWAAAAAEERPAEAGVFRAWSERRLLAIEEVGWTLTVGHVDVLALPPSPGP